MWLFYYFCCPNAVFLIHAGYIWASKITLNRNVQYSNTNVIRHFASVQIVLVHPVGYRTSKQQAIVKQKWTDYVSRKCIGK